MKVGPNKIIVTALQYSIIIFYIKLKKLKPYDFDYIRAVALIQG